MARMALGKDFAERPATERICVTPRPAPWTGGPGGLQ
jgi:hypothetical protein